MCPPPELFLAWALCRTSLWLYAEWPHRVRVLKLIDVGSHIEIEKLHLAKEEQFPACEKERLKALTPEQPEKLPGCNMIVEWTVSFKGTVEPGKACIAFRKGRKPISIVNLRLIKTNLSASTEGATQKPMSIFWGSYAWPFVRWGSFADDGHQGQGQMSGPKEELEILSFRIGFLLPRPPSPSLIACCWADSIDERVAALNPSLPTAIRIEVTAETQGLPEGKFRAMRLKTVCRGVPR